MPDDLLADPEIAALLQEADSMLHVLEQVGQDDPGNVRQALDDIYRDLGRALHRRLPRSDAFEDEETTAVTSRVAEAMVASPPDPDEEPTPPAEPPPDLEQAPADNLASRGLPSGTPTRRVAKRQRREERAAAVAATQERRDARAKKSTSGTPPPEGKLAFGRAAMRSQRGGAWIGQLADLLELIPLPMTLDDPFELAAEASLVQWATVDLDDAWSPYPPAVRAALLGLLSARARDLQERLAVDVGPRIALERLGAYREHAGLSKVEGLYPERAAATGSWAADAREWWNTLIGGLRGS